MDLHLFLQLGQFAITDLLQNDFSKLLLSEPFLWIFFPGLFIESNVKSNLVNKMPYGIILGGTINF